MLKQRMLMQAIRPRDVDMPPPIGFFNGISNVHISLDALYAACDWDEAWVCQIKSLSPKDLTFLHRQMAQRLDRLLPMVSRVAISLRKIECQGAAAGRVWTKTQNH